MNSNAKREKFRFGWSDPYSTYEATLEIDDEGAIQYVGYGSSDINSNGSSTGWYSKCSTDKDFISDVKRVMRILIEHDSDEFKRMRNCLNDDYVEIADQEKRLAAIRTSTGFDL